MQRSKKKTELSGCIHNKWGNIDYLHEDAIVACDVLLTRILTDADIFVQFPLVVVCTVHLENGFGNVFDIM